MQLKIFVSTQETQGQRSNDFCFVPEGEIVIPPVITCTGETADGHCGCKRCMCGVSSHKSTTTMKVAEFTGGIFLFEQKVRASLDKSGWLTRGSDPTEEIVEDIIAAAEKLPIGAVVEYRDGVFTKRLVAPNSGGDTANRR